MYGAGKLEGRNIHEDETAARYTAQSGYHEFVECLLIMAEVEWQYFRACAESHRWARRICLWPSPAPKEAIRATFNSEPGSAPAEVERAPEECESQSEGA